MSALVLAHFCDAILVFIPRLCVLCCSEGQSSHQDGERYSGGGQSSFHCEVALW